MKDEIKITCIDFTIRNPFCNSVSYTYVNGKRIRKTDHYSRYIPKNYSYDKTICKTNRNKNGIEREYTIIIYKKDNQND